MYRINKNTRCMKSCDLVYESLLQIVEEKPFNKISISDLSKHSTVSRATIYRHFDDVVDVFKWRIDLEMKESFIGADYLVIEDIAHLSDLFYRYWTSNTRLLDGLIKANLTPLFLSSLYNVLAFYFRPILDNSSISEETDPYLLHLWSTTIGSILYTWTVSGKKESAEKLSSIHLYNFTYPK